MSSLLVLSTPKAKAMVESFLMEFSRNYRTILRKSNYKTIEVDIAEGSKSDSNRIIKCDPKPLKKGEKIEEIIWFLSLLEHPRFEAHLSVQRSGKVNHLRLLTPCYQSAKPLSLPLSSPLAIYPSTLSRKIIPVFLVFSTCRCWPRTISS